VKLFMLEGLERGETTSRPNVELEFSKSAENLV
jgi:hypothetical protein